MQRQQINSDANSNIESNLNKQHSRSVRKLYNRIGNNIRVLNKSRVSNRSNNSIGSVALRRTELSNDKIYSREQDFLVNDSREIDFQSEINNLKGSINSNTKNEQSSSCNNNKYRQRIKLSKQSFSRRSSSQKSYRQNQGIVKKPTKHQIEKLFMMEDQNVNNGGYTKQYNPKRDNYGGRQNYQKSKRIEENNNYRKEYKQSIRSSRQRQQQSNSNIRSYKLMKSSLKSNIKSSKHLSRQSKDIYNRNYYNQQSQVSVNGSQMEKLSRKYNNSKNKNQQFNVNINAKNDIKYREKYQDDNNYQLKKHIDNRPSQYQIQRNKKQQKYDYYYAEKQRFSRQNKQKQLRDYKNKQKIQAIQRESSRQRQKQKQYHKLQRYKSQKYMSTNDSEIMSNKRESKNQKDRHYKESQKLRQKNQNKTKQSSKQLYSQRQLQPQNSLQKYQHEQWTREQNRRHAKENHKHISEKLLLMQQQSVFEDRRENKYNRQKYKHHNDRQRSSTLLLKSKNNQSQFRKDIRIKQKLYAYLYGQKQSDAGDDSRVRRSSKKMSYKINSQSSRMQSPMSPRTPKNYQQNEYFAHMTPTSAASTKNYLSAKHSPTTQISSTLDSLLLSINSHISLSQDQRSSTSALIDKLNLHIKTLQIISDYSKEFKKMYEDIEQWQELIFLSYKKYWVERVKVIEYLKKFIIPSKRHSSQRINLKVTSSNKNGKDQPLSSPIIQDPFSNNTLLQNPFVIPFCKLSQQQLNKLSRSPQISKLFSQLDQETSQVYKHLQQLYNQFITKCHNPNMNMLSCDNFSDEVYLQMLAEIQKLLPNLEQFKTFQVTKIRLGKIVKAGILMLHINGKYVRNISQILMFDDCEKIGQKRKIKAFTTYDLYYQVFEKLVVE